MELPGSSAERTRDGQHSRLVVTYTVADADSEGNLSVFLRVKGPTSLNSAGPVNLTFNRGSREAR